MTFIGYLTIIVSSIPCAGSALGESSILAIPKEDSIPRSGNPDWEGDGCGRYSENPFAGEVPSGAVEPVTHACPNKKGLIFCNILIFKI